MKETKIYWKKIFENGMVYLLVSDLLKPHIMEADTAEEEDYVYYETDCIVLSNTPDRVECCLYDDDDSDCLTVDVIEILENGGNDHIKPSSKEEYEDLLPLAAEWAACQEKIIKKLQPILLQEL